MITEIYREIVHCVADEICDKFVEHVHETAGKDKEVSSEWVAKELKNFFGTYDYTELVLEQMECVAWSPACPEIISDMELYYALEIYVESRGEIKKGAIPNEPEIAVEVLRREYYPKKEDLLVELARLVKKSLGN